MNYQAIRGFNYKGRRFEVGDEVLGLPIKETKQLIKDQTIEDVSGETALEEAKETVEETVRSTSEEGGEDVDD